MMRKIALGFGNNTDYEIEWSPSVIESLIIDWNIFEQEVGTITTIKTERDLVLSILEFVRSSSGGERFVEDSTILESFSNRFTKKITIGGTCPRAAIAMNTLGYSSILHLVTMNDYIRELIPENVEWTCSNDHDSSYPHLIVQFPVASTIKANNIEYSTTRANRIIYDNDYDNIVMKLNPVFFNTSFQNAEIILISGFNAMQDYNLLKERLIFLDKVFSSNTSCKMIMYEDACFHKQDFSKLVQYYLCKHINIYSMNEDELQTYIGRKLDLLDPIIILNTVKILYKNLSVPIIVVHSKFWALAYGRDAGRYADSLKGGITMATTRFRFGDNFTKLQYQETYQLPEEKEGIEFSINFEKLAKGFGCCRSSVHVEEIKVTTIGLGDAFVGGFLPPLTEYPDTSSD